MKTLLTLYLLALAFHFHHHCRRPRPSGGRRVRTPEPTPNSGPAVESTPEVESGHFLFSEPITSSRIIFTSPDTNCSCPFGDPKHPIVRDCSLCHAWCTLIMSWKSLHRFFCLRDKRTWIKTSTSQFCKAITKCYKWKPADTKMIGVNLWELILYWCQPKTSCIKLVPFEKCMYFPHEILDD